MNDTRTASLTLRSARSELHGRVERIESLTGSEREDLFRLLDSYFRDVVRERFERDLAEKEWVVLLDDLDGGRIVGFSTLMRLDISIEGKSVCAFFSGDTIVDPSYWRETALGQAWMRLLFDEAAKVREGQAYWFLISSGYKTYRVLPTFFRTFYPTWQNPTPPLIQRTLDTLATLKFGEQYDRESGIIHLEAATPLRSGIADLSPARSNDPHIAFFANANPGHVRGDELACLTEIHPANLTPAGRRMLGLPRISHYRPA